MLYVKNLPVWERLLRGAGALAMGAAALLMPGAGPWAWLLAASAAGALLSSLLGFCPACALFGRKPG
ncbi:YgaP-like transmembrane domain [Roseateles cavernae]|uniref:YgaP-like transmembrane domain n=1 Tax=Roseateles cavernae TaxID=3153578 RepID=UPI0032E44A8D